MTPQIAGAWLGRFITFGWERIASPFLEASQVTAECPVQLGRGVNGGSWCSARDLPWTTWTTAHSTEIHGSRLQVEGNLPSTGWFPNCHDADILGITLPWKGKLLQMFGTQVFDTPLKIMTPFLLYGFQFVRHDKIGLTGCGCWIAGKDLWLVKETVVTELYPGWCLRNCFCRQVSTGPSSHLWWHLYNMLTSFACELKMSCCPSSSFYPCGSQSKEWGTIGTI